MAHLSTIPPPPRCRCGRLAKVQLFNHYNAPCGFFCLRHGAEELKRAESFTVRPEAPRG